MDYSRQERRMKAEIPITTSLIGQVIWVFIGARITVL